jgi:DNA-binding transcriptional MerR regulator/uridine kinase
MAERAGIAPHVLRYYEREGLLPEVERARNGFRQYTDEDLVCLKRICLLRDTGMPLASIQKVMVSSGKEEKMEEEYQLLHSHLQKTRAQIADLTKKADQLEQYCAGLEQNLRQIRLKQNSSARDIELLLAEHAQKYPRMHPQDAVKLLYQNEFGGGHIIPNPEASLRFLQEEFSRIPHTQKEISWESIGGGIARLNLDGLQEDWLPTVNRLFVAGSAHQSGSEEQFSRKLDELIAAGQQGILPFPQEELNDFLSIYRQNHCPMVSHSPDYREAYHPAYRIIPEKYLGLLPIFLEIDRQIAEKGRTVLAIDGRCGSGKSTLAALFREIYEADIVHMDDFFLPPAKRTPERLAEPGGNFDRERFLAEVAPGLQSGQPFSYRIFDCGQMQYRGERNISAGSLVIVEGSYCMHPDLSSLYGCKLFVTCPSDVQKRRIFDRNGAALYPRFIKEWIPMEETYFHTFRIAENCGWILDSSLQSGCFIRQQ